MLIDFNIFCPYDVWVMAGFALPATSRIVEPTYF
jgi:hypothetical protein